MIELSAISITRRRRELKRTETLLRPICIRLCVSVRITLHGIKPSPLYFIPFSFTLLPSSSSMHAVWTAPVQFASTRITSCPSRSFNLQMCWSTWMHGTGQSTVFPYPLSNPSCHICFFSWKRTSHKPICILLSLFWSCSSSVFPGPVIIAFLTELSSCGTRVNLLPHSIFSPLCWPILPPSTLPKSSRF